MEKLIYFNKKDKIELHEADHLYSVDGNIDPNQISITGIVGSYSKHYFLEDKDWHIMTAISLKGGINNMWAIKKNYDDYMTIAKDDGTRIHKQIENQEIDIIEDFLHRHVNLGKECEITREKRVGVKGFNKTIFGSIDYISYNSDTKHLKIVDFKVSKQDKVEYLTKQLNIGLMLLTGNTNPDDIDKVSLYGLMIDKKRDDYGLKLVVVPVLTEEETTNIIKGVLWEKTKE